MKMLYGCPFEKIHFLTRIETNSGFDTLWKKSNNDTFIAFQMKIKTNSNSMHGVKSAKKIFFALHFFTGASDGGKYMSRAPYE